MRPRRFIWTLFIGGIAAVLVFVAVRQSRANDALRGEAAALRTVVRNLNTERVAQEALVKLDPKPEEIKELATDPPEEDRLRAEIEQLKAEVAASPKPLKAKDAKPASASYSQMERILEAARRGGTQELADLITFDSGDEEQAESLYAQIPESLRGQYANAKHLVAAVVAQALTPPNTGGPVVSKEQMLKDKNTVIFHLEPHGIPPTPNPRPLDCVFRRTKGDKWLLVVSPAMMASFRQAAALAAEKK